MGIIAKFLERRRMKRYTQGFFGMFPGYTPVFTSIPESIYEMEVVRAAIHAFANFVSLMKLEVKGTALAATAKQWQTRVNPLMDTSKFLYRLATILSVNNNAFIAPMLQEDGQLVGFYPLMPQMCEIVEDSGMLWLRYHTYGGDTHVIEFDRVGIVTQHQYSNELFGEANVPLRTTLRVINANNDTMLNSMESSAIIRFTARAAGVYKDEDLESIRRNFAKANLSQDNKSTMLLFDGRLAEVKQVHSRPMHIDPVQVKHIQSSVFNYFGINEAILQNNYTEEQFNAFFEGKIAPYANQLAQVLTNMTFTPRQIAHGNEIAVTMNRLQYVSNNTKLELATRGLDRGLLTPNEARAMFGLAPIDKEYANDSWVRGEYVTASEAANPAAQEEGGGEE